MSSYPTSFVEEPGLLLYVLWKRDLGVVRYDLGIMGIIGSLVAWPSQLGTSLFGGMCVAWWRPSIRYSVDGDCAWSDQRPSVVSSCPVAPLYWLCVDRVVLLVECFAKLDTLVSLLVVGFKVGPGEIVFRTIGDPTVQHMGWNKV